MLALIVIDQQKGVDHPKLGARNNLDAERIMLDILDRFREKKLPVFHIIHRSSDPESVFWPKQEGFEVKDDFEVKDGEYLIEKTVPCAFSQNVLDKYLNKLGIDTIVIVGVATNNSVESTARTGGNLGYTVYVIENACFCFAKADYFGENRSARDVHAMSLANLDGEYASVMTSLQLFEKIEN